MRARAHMRPQQKFERIFKQEQSLNSRFFLHIIIKKFGLKNNIIDSAYFEEYLFFSRQKNE